MSLEADSEEDAGASGFSRPGSNGALPGKLGIVRLAAQMIDNLVGREEVRGVWSNSDPAVKRTSDF